MTGPVRSITTPLSPVGPARTGPLAAPPFEQAAPVAPAEGAALLPVDANASATLAAVLPPAGAVDDLVLEDDDEATPDFLAPLPEAVEVTQGGLALADGAMEFLGHDADGRLRGAMGETADLLARGQTVVAVGVALSEGDMGGAVVAVAEHVAEGVVEDFGAVQAGAAAIAEGDWVEGAATMLEGGAGLVEDAAGVARVVGASSAAGALSRGAPVLGVAAGVADMAVALSSDPPDYEAAAVGAVETVGSAMMAVPGPTQVVGAALVAGAMIYENWDSITAGAGAAVDWLTSWW